jgi:RsiW-degrading membrane proteinase PrsW (M82 family)
VLSLVVWFKIRLAPPNDLFAGAEPSAILARLAEAGRYREILAGFGSAILEIGARGVLPLLLIVYLMMAGLAPGARTRDSARMPALVVVLMLVGYAAVLLAVPAPLLDTNVRSINRLLLQLLPSALLAYFLTVGTVEEAKGARAVQGTDADRSDAVS